MSKFGDKEHGDRSFHCSEGKSKEVKDASGKKIGDASHCDLAKPYYKEKDAQTWKDRVLRHDRKLEKMAKCLGRLEALVGKRGFEDAKDCWRSKKRHGKREDNKDTDLGNLTKQKVASS